MTSEEKLQELFAAALRAPETNKITPQQPPQYRAPSTVAAQPEMETPPPIAAAPIATAAEPTEAIALVSPMDNAGLDHETSVERARMLDEKEAIKRKRDRRNRVVTMVAAITIFGSGTGWMLSSPERMETMRKAMAEIRMVGNANEMAAKYDDALAEIATHRDHVDAAATMLGVSPDAAAHEDESMTAEMEAFTRTSGNAIAERNQALTDRLGRRVAKTAAASDTAP